MNDESSRSHLVTQILIKRKPKGGVKGECTWGKLNIIDLAGSEKYDSGTNSQQ
jgi:hypothetical protein